MTYVNDFPDWEEALREYQTTEDDAARMAFESRLRAGRFLAAMDTAEIAVSDPAEDGRATPTGHTVVERMVADALDGGRYLVFFTSLAELEKKPGYGCVEVSFQELYDEVINDKTKAGAVVNPAGQMLALKRMELNWLMDVARDAGQEGFAARELAHSVQLAHAWPPELQQAFARALSRRPEVREAYMAAKNVAWREDEPELLFMIGFDGDETDLYPYLTEILEPLLGGVQFKFERVAPALLQIIRTAVLPVYLRPDVSEKWEAVNSGRLPFPLFENWDAEVRAFRANFDGTEDREITAAFESKLCAAHFYMPLDAKKNPKAVDYPEIGPLLPVFTDWSKLAEIFKPGIRVMLWPFAAIYAVVARYTLFGGVVINPGNNNLIIARRQLDRIHRRTAGGSGAHPGLAQTRIPRRRTEWKNEEKRP
jgi:hypothetical protein